MIFYERVRWYTIKPDIQTREKIIFVGIFFLTLVKLTVAVVRFWLHQFLFHSFPQVKMLVTVILRCRIKIIFSNINEWNVCSHQKTSINYLLKIYRYSNTNYNSFKKFKSCMIISVKVLKNFITIIKRLLTWNARLWKNIAYVMRIQGLLVLILCNQNMT